MEIQAVNKLKFIEVSALNLKDINLNQLSIGSIERGEQTRVGFLNHPLDTDVLNNIEECKGDVGMGRLELLDGLDRSVQSVTNFVADKHIGTILTDGVIQKGQIQNPVSGVERSGLVVTLDDSDVLAGQKLCHDTCRGKVGMLQSGFHVTNKNTLPTICKQ